MKLPSSTLIIALLLLIGAGGIVVYQTWPGEVELKGWPDPGKLDNSKM